MCLFFTDSAGLASLCLILKVLFLFLLQESPDVIQSIDDRLAKVCVSVVKLFQLLIAS